MARPVQLSMAVDTDAKKPEAAYLGTSGLVSRVGVEPTTYGLKVRCSTS